MSSCSIKVGAIEKFICRVCNWHFQRYVATGVEQLPCEKCEGEASLETDVKQHNVFIPNIGDKKLQEKYLSDGAVAGRMKKDMAVWEERGDMKSENWRKENWLTSWYQQFFRNRGV